MMDVDKSLKLYRYISFKRFCELLFQQELTFVHPDMWPDQYETFVVRRLAAEQNKEVPLRISRIVRWPQLKRIRYY
jgi:hypothetical protein